MPNTAQTSQDIEREIEDERAGLARTLDALRDQFSSANIVQSVTDTVRDNSGELAQSISRSVKQNPLAVTLTGVGLAWLILGNNQSSRSHDSRRSAYDRRRPVGTGFAGSRQSVPDYERRVAAAQSEIARTNAEMGLDDDEADDFTSQWEGARRQTSFGDTPYDDDTRSDGQSGRMDAAKRRARQTGNRMRASATELQDRIGENTEKFSSEARKRIMSARRRAVEAQARLEYKLGDTRDRAGQMYEEQPLLAGAIAFALGAAAGSALPRTDEEDYYMGEASDRLFAEADRIYREESAKLKHVAGAAVDEAKDTARETMKATGDKVPSGKEAVEMAEDKARESGKRVADAAKDEAKKQNLRGV